MRYEGDFEGAMVQFSLPSEAKKAHDNTEAVLNNRFIKVYYLRRDHSYNGPPPPMECSLEVGGGGKSGWVSLRTGRGPLLYSALRR